MLRLNNQERYIVYDLFEIFQNGTIKVSSINLSSNSSCTCCVYDVVNKSQRSVDKGWLLSNKNKIIGYFDSYDVVMEITKLEYELDKLLSYDSFYTSAEPPNVFIVDKKGIVFKQGIVYSANTTTIVRHLLENPNMCKIENDKLVAPFVVGITVYYLVYKIKNIGKFTKLLTMRSII